MDNLIKARKKTRSGFQKKDWPKKYLETISCLLCGSTSSKKLYPKSYRRIVSCSNCGLIYTNPRLKKKYLKHLYSEEYFHNTESSHFGYENYLNDEKKIVKTFSKRAREIEKVFGKKGKLLDIGCATGFFMKAAKDLKWKTEGVEISEFAANYASRHFKFKVYQDDFLSLDLPEKTFDVITLWDVVEHFYNPKAALIKINKLLKPGGMLVISTPDVDSLPAKITKSKWVGYKLSDEHLSYFSQSTIKKLLTKTGFSIIKKGHVGKHVSMDMLSDRASIYSPLTGKAISAVSKFLPRDYFIYVNPFDIMCIYAKKSSE